MTTVSRRSTVLGATARTFLRPIFEHVNPAGPGRIVLRGTVAAGSVLGGMSAAAGTRVVDDVVPGEMIVPGHLLDDAIILYLHGGGYVAGSARLERAVTSDLAAATGMRVLALDYRLAPAHPFPAARTDALAAYRSLIARGYAPGRIAVVGVSAGAHLAMSMLTTLIEIGETGPGAVVLFSPLLDTSCEEALRADSLTRDPFLPPVFAQRCAGVYVGSRDRRSAHLDVFQAPTSMLAEMPPIVSFVGSTECFASDAVRLHTALLDAGVPSSTFTVPGQVHSFVSLCRRLPEARTSVLDAAAFLRRRLSSDSPELTEMPELADSPDHSEADTAMTGLHSLTPTDDSFFDTAPVRGSHTVFVPVSPARLWRELSADDAVKSWSPGVTQTKWDVSTVRGVGAVRNVTLLGAATVEERFYRWDENRRMTFSASGISRPICRAFAEDYILEPEGAGTRFTWRAAMDPVGPVFVHKVAGSGLSAVLAHMTKGLVRRSLDG
ncbi:MAG TPA: alpha/beta hydrolase fold domain-containing protein [Rhodococcus sp. (in: high G+C Gram-positive bacteria)]|nr:alpha/beta hydrolase fold domain-containing protein [Rhodococcus sp. (in: high G+C Gram-positive bacteria)]